MYPGPADAGSPLPQPTLITFEKVVLDEDGCAFLPAGSIRTIAPTVAADSSSWTILWQDNTKILLFHDEHAMYERTCFAAFLATGEGTERPPASSTDSDQNARELWSPDRTYLRPGELAVVTRGWYRGAVVQGVDGGALGFPGNLPLESLDCVLDLDVDEEDLHAEDFRRSRSFEHEIYVV